MLMVMTMAAGGDNSVSGEDSVDGGDYSGGGGKYEPGDDPLLFQRLCFPSSLSLFFSI